jgi:hypothetical protein
MSETVRQEITTQMVGPVSSAEATDALVAVAAASAAEAGSRAGDKSPPETSAVVAQQTDQRLDQLLNRINQLRMGPGAPTVPDEPVVQDENVFCPIEPTYWEQAQVNEA